MSSPDEPPGVVKRREAERDNWVVFYCAGLVLFCVTIVLHQRGNKDWWLIGILDAIYLGVLLGTSLRRRNARKPKQYG